MDGRLDDMLGRHAWTTCLDGMVGSPHTVWRIRKRADAAAGRLRDLGKVSRPHRPHRIGKVGLHRAVLLLVLGLVHVAVSEIDVCPRVLIVVVEEEAEGAHALMAVDAAARLLDTRMHRHIPQAVERAHRLLAIASHALQANVNAK